MVRYYWSERLKFLKERLLLRAERHVMAPAVGLVNVADTEEFVTGVDRAGFAWLAHRHTGIRHTELRLFGWTVWKSAPGVVVEFKPEHARRTPGPL